MAKKKEVVDTKKVVPTPELDFGDDTFPNKMAREARRQEIKLLLKPLVEQRDKLQHEINEYVLEADILTRLDKLQDYSEGKIDLEFTEKTS